MQGYKVKEKTASVPHCTPSFKTQWAPWKPPEFGQPIHFFLECPLYQYDRTSLFNYFNNIVPISIEYINFGCNEISDELNTLSVQKFIRQTCRFNN
jgi:hypothetical protein